MVNMSFHRVEDLEVTEIRQQERTGSYTREIKINGQVIDLYSDNKEDLQFEV